MANRIWIELDKPTNKAHAEEQCRLANNMLKRLKGSPNDDTGEFFYTEHKGRKRYAFGGPMGYVDLPDNGHWLNLDYLGRDTPAITPEQAAIAQQACDQYASDEIGFDAPTPEDFSAGEEEDSGCWVRAWVWVAADSD